MKKVVIDARESGTSTGRYIDKLIEYLHKLRPELEVVVLAKDHRLEFMHGIAPSFKVIETPFKEFSFGEQLGFKKQIASLHPDLVHFGMVQQPILYRGRVVTTMHDLTTVRFRNPAKNPVVFTIKQQVYKQVNKIAARKSSAILVPSQYVKDDVANYTRVSPDKITVTHEAADKITEAAKAIDTLKNKQFIMYIGRPTPHKNLGRLIEAFQILQQSTPDLWLVLAGKKDTLYEAHERSVKEKGIKNVLFTGFITEGELRWLYEHTACYVFPSLSEGFGLPGLEAMAHGAPVASSKATCLPEIYGEAAIYFDATDSRAVAEAVGHVIGDRKLADELKTAGAQQLKKYSWEHMARETLDVYSQVLSL
jgi:glycosyltransferase involved in cell wall biosynthesis